MAEAGAKASSQEKLPVKQIVLTTKNSNRNSSSSFGVTKTQVDCCISHSIRFFGLLILSVLFSALGLAFRFIRAMLFSNSIQFNNPIPVASKSSQVRGIPLFPDCSAATMIMLVPPLAMLLCLLLLLPQPMLGLRYCREKSIGIEFQCKLIIYCMPQIVDVAIANDIVVVVVLVVDS